MQENHDKPGTYQSVDTEYKKENEVEIIAWEIGEFIFFDKFAGQEYNEYSGDQGTRNKQYLQIFAHPCYLCNEFM